MPLVTRRRWALRSAGRSAWGNLRGNIALLHHGSLFVSPYKNENTVPQPDCQNRAVPPRTSEGVRIQLQCLFVQQPSDLSMYRICRRCGQVPGSKRPLSHSTLPALNLAKKVRRDYRPLYCRSDKGLRDVLRSVMNIQVHVTATRTSPPLLGTCNSLSDQFFSPSYNWMFQPLSA